MEKLTWIKKLNIQELHAPYVVEKDENYYDDLKSKYCILYQLAEKAGADEESLKIINKYSKKVKESIRQYYDGKISSAHNKIKNLVKGCADNELAVNTITNSKAFPGKKETEIQFFRARLSEDVHAYKAKEMLHLPLSMRGKTGNYRFSIPGIPSLYLGNISYACWIELGCPPEYKLNVSPVVLDGTQKIFNLAVMTRSIEELHESNKSTVQCWLKLLILMIATSYTVKESNRIFKSEYIVSQSIMLACKELGYDGVAYFSKRVSDEMFAYAAINLALFAPYRPYKKYSTICEHIKVDDSFNYSMYKQLGDVNRKRTYDLRLTETGIITNIGEYRKERQFEYAMTEFCAFDKFLFSTWKEKNVIEWGNALK
ncbi:MAG: hypothetical protein ACI4U3_00395 [Traorella sp.]